MTVQTVPYALQNASHSAAVFRQATSAPFQSAGILGVGELAVSQQGTPNMSVILGAGRAMVAGSQVTPPSGLAFTTQAMYNVLNDGSITLTVTTANATNPRIDAVYVGVQDAFYSGSNNQAVAGVVAGTPAPSPVAPSIPVNSYLIGYIAVGAGVTSIVTANITQQTSIAGLVGGRPGLVAVAPTSVVGATASPNGGLSFTSVLSFSANGVFTTAFDNYLIVLDIYGQTNTAGGVLFLRSAGTDDATANYTSIQDYDQGSTHTTASVALLSTGWSALPVAVSELVGEFTMFNPALPRPTRGQATFNAVLSPSSLVSQRASYRHNASAVFDGFTYKSSGGGGGALTGTCRIYGYNNN